MITTDTIVAELQVSSEQLADKLSEWATAIFLQLPNFVLAIIIFFIAYFVVGFVKRGARKLVGRYSNNQTIVNLSANVSAVVFSVIMALIILSIFNLNGAVNKFLATAGVLGLAIGLALQDPIQNLFSGVLMSVRNLYNIGDIVETNGYFGTISDISLRSTLLTTPQGQKVTIPNKDVIQNPLTNYSYSGRRRLDLTCGISYGENLDEVKRIATQAVEGIDDIDKNSAVNFFYTEFGDSSINFVIQIWFHFKAQSDYNKFKSDVIIKLKKAFDKEGIVIPFPIRTLDFGIKGGTALDQMINNK